jgi:hypothetical protein
MATLREVFSKVLCSSDIPHTLDIGHFLHLISHHHVENQSLAFIYCLYFMKTTGENAQ